MCCSRSFLLANPADGCRGRSSPLGMALVSRIEACAELVRSGDAVAFLPMPTPDPDTTCLLMKRFLNRFDSRSVFISNSAPVLGCSALKVPLVQAGKRLDRTHRGEAIPHPVHSIETAKSGYSTEAASRHRKPVQRRAQSRKPELPTPARQQRYRPASQIRTPSLEEGGAVCGAIHQDKTAHRATFIACVSQCPLEQH